MSSRRSEGTSEHQLETSEYLDYFRTVEALFLELRGAPLLISPDDGAIVHAWWQREIPVSVIRATLEDLFERRRQRGAEDRVLTLRYCRRPVENAWSQIESLRHGAERAADASGADESALDVAQRTERLARQLPSALPNRAHFIEQLEGLASESERLSPNQLESRLELLDEELLQALAASLSPAAAREIGDRVQSALERTASQVPGAKRSAVEERLRRQAIRRHFDVPVLSLFAAEAPRTGVDREL